MVQTRAYPKSLREEELKNKVAADWFGAFDCSRIIGNIDFCVDVPATELSLGYDAEPMLWAEAKAGVKRDIVASFVQLILTIGGQHTADRSLPPHFLGAFDAEKIAFLPYNAVLGVLGKNDFDWTVAPSDHESKEFKELYSLAKGAIEHEKLLFRYEDDEAALRRFIKANFKSGRRDISRILINKNNFTHIYRQWREAVLPFIDAPWDVLKKKYGIYDRDFYLAEMNIDDNGTADISDDRIANDFYITFDAKSPTPYTVRRKNEDNLFSSLSFGFKNNVLTQRHRDTENGKRLCDSEPLSLCVKNNGLDAYSAFWRRYKRPPKKEYWNYIVNRLDLLVPQDVRERKGAFFTPQAWVELSQRYLADVLGENWQEEYYVWDCAGGTGNMEVGLTDKYRVWVSTLDQQDVDVMHERIRNGANLLESHVFRFDFLNDSFDNLPKGLKEIIDDPERRRKLVMYFNPPYAEAASTRTKTGTGENKSGVASHSLNAKLKPRIGAAVNELFALFLMRIHDEIPGCVIGQFSTLKHLQAPNFKTFRKEFAGRLEKCFLVPADTFDNVKGKFPIGFFVWRLGEESDNKRICSGLTAFAEGDVPFVSGVSREQIRLLKIREFLEGEPVAKLTGHEFEEVKGLRALKDAVYATYERMGLRVVHPEIGTIFLTHGGVGDSIHHGIGRAKVSAFLAVPEILKNGMVAAHRHNWKGRGYDSFIVMAPVEIGGLPYCAIVIVNSTRSNGYRFYLHEVGKIDDIKKYAEVMRAGSSDVKSALSRNLGDIRSIAYSIFAVNGVSENIFTSTIADVYDRKGELIGTKTIHSNDGVNLLMDWIRRFYDKTGERLAYCRYLGSDFQNNNGVFITLKPSPNDLKQVKGNWITERNLAQFCVYFAVRLCIDADWLNDRDQFLFPKEKWADDSLFISDCIVWTLFSTQNRVSSCDGVNHWIPFAEEEVGAKDCFKSHFMSDYLRDSASLRENLSPAARAVLDAGRELWRYYHAQPDADPNASFYDIRLHFQGAKTDAKGKTKMNSTSSDETYALLLANLRAAMKDLARQIEPKVYEYGFLKR